MSATRLGGFEFKKFDTLGAEAAEYDADYLSECFYDSGYFSILRDPQKLPCIVLGRTGSGKTALLSHMRDSLDRTIWLDPDSLSLQYLSGSNVLKFLNDNGIHLDIFYKLLWKHIFVVELLRERFDVRDATSRVSMFSLLRNMFHRDPKKDKAVRYLEEWGTTFWERTEYRIKELTTKLETDIGASLGAKFGGFDSSLSSKSGMSSEEKAEFIYKAQTVVNQIQIAELNEVFKVLGDLFNDSMSPFYILIDRLDENWVEDSIRYRLIRSLMESVRDFSKIPGVKIIVALRRDLIERVFKLTYTSGSQDEKFESCYLRLRWTSDDLMKILDRRISKLVRSRYMKREVTHKDVLPPLVGSQSVEEYITERTLYRPRDIIMFINECINHASNREAITVSMLRDAEAEYSKKRLESLADEWRVDHPDLMSFAELLHKKPVVFKASSLTNLQLENKCFDVSIEKATIHGPLSKLAVRVVEQDLELDPFRRELLAVFYQVGLVGIKLDSDRPVLYSFLQNSYINSLEIKTDVSISICPTFHRALHISTGNH